MRLAATLSAVLILIAPVGAQQPPAPAGTLRFEAASVQPVSIAALQDDLQTISDLLSERVHLLPGDRLEVTATLRTLVAYAYGFDRHWDRAIGTDPVLDERYAVSARGAAGSFDTPTGDDLSAARHMLQQLLKEWFQVAVTVRDEVRRAMVLRRVDPGSFGPLRPIRGGCVEGTRAEADAQSRVACVWSQQGAKLKAVVKDFDDFAARISRTSRQDVVNETGLVGSFAFETSFDPYTGAFWTPGAKPHEINQPSFADALKKDLGLVVDYADRPARVLAVTHVEPLREN